MNENRKNASKGNSRNYSNKGKRNRKPFNKGVDKETQECVTNSNHHVITSSTADNDSKWYTHIYPLVSDIASLPYNIPAGTGFRMAAPKEQPPIDQATQYKVDMSTANCSVPGIMTIAIAPTIGVSAGPDSAPNIAAQQIYTLTRKANSGAINYDKTDLMMMIMAMDSAYMLYEDLLRAYRLLGSYNYMNRYLPNALLDALGYSSDLGKSLADFRGVLDLFAYQLASINIPDQFYFIHRHSWLFSNVYKDSEASTAQMYAYVMDGLYVWTEGVDNAPTSLQYTSREKLFGSGAGLIDSMDQIRTAINKVMQPLLGSQDVGTMSGDLAKAFGEGGMIKIKPVADHEWLEPVYSSEVLHQIMNCDDGAPIDRKTLNITVNNDNLISGPYIQCQPKVHATEVTALMRQRNKVLNIYDKEATPDMNMVYTRLMFAIGNFEKDEVVLPGYFNIISCGTEIVCGIAVYRTQVYEDGTTKPNTVGTGIFQDLIANNNKFDIGRMMEIANLCAFRFSPSIYLWEDMGDSTVKFRNVFQDFDKYTVVVDNQVINMNNAAIMSEFAAKDYGTAFTS